MTWTDRGDGVWTIRTWARQQGNAGKIAGIAIVSATVQTVSFTVQYYLRQRHRQPKMQASRRYDVPSHPRYVVKVGFLVLLRLVTGQ